MKKIIMFILAFFVLLAPLSVSATETDNGEDDGIESLKENIISTVSNIMMAQEYNDDPEKTEVRFDKAEKIYIDTGIETLGQKDLESVKKYLSGSDYVYVVPVYTEKHFFTVTLAKGFGNETEVNKNVFTEDEINYFEENVDRWHITEVLEPAVKDYYDTIKEIENSTGYHNIFLIGGMPEIRMPIAVVCDEEKIVGIADLGYSSIYLEELTLNSEAPLAISEGTSVLYDYDAVIEGVNEYKDTLSREVLSEGVGGMMRGEEEVYLAVFISTVCLLAAMVAVSVFIIKKLINNYRNK